MKVVHYFRNFSTSLRSYFSLLYFSNYFVIYCIKMTDCESEKMMKMESENQKVTELVCEKWTKAGVYELIRGAPQRITYQVNESPKATSDAWTKFKIICIDGKAVDFVKCNDCISVFQWKAKMGTATIMKHKCNIPELKFHHSDSTGAGTQLQLTQLFPKKVPSSETDKLNDLIVTGLAKDLRPLSTVESEGFRHIAQALITFGAKFGNQQLENIIHCRRTLKEKHLPKIAGTLRCNLKNMLAQSPSFPFFSFTFDLWTESKKQRHFLSLTCHFVDQHYQVQSKLMGAHEFPVDLRKTMLNIREECSKILSIYFEEKDVPSF